MDEDAQLELGLVLVAIEVVEQHLFRQHRALAQAQQFQEGVFLARQADRLIADHDHAVVEVHQQLAGADRRLRQPL